MPFYYSETVKSFVHCKKGSDGQGRTFGTFDRVNGRSHRRRSISESFLAARQPVHPSQEWAQQAGQMFREFDPERPLLPSLQIKRTTMGDVALLFCLQPTRHAGVMHHQ